jgi:hypothetical protein
MNLGLGYYQEDFESMDNKPLLKPAFSAVDTVRWHYSGEYNKIN